MKKQAKKVQTEVEEEGLCCCEYVNRHGERSHIAACCCDCEDLDDACDSTALCFTCAWYSSIVTGGLFHLLLVQVINISYNVTEREARAALREKTARSAYWGLVVDTGVYSLGLRGNWSEFISMGDNLKPASPADLV